MAHHRDTGGLFEVRALDRVNWCFESGRLSFSHMPICAEDFWLLVWLELGLVVSLGCVSLFAGLLNEL